MNEIMTLAFLALLVTVLSYLIKRFTTKPGDSAKPVNAFGLRETFLGCLIICASIIGLAGSLMIPNSVFSANYLTNPSVTLIIYIATSMILLMSGMKLKGLTGRFLMILGVILLVVNIIPFVNNMSRGIGLVAVLIAFIVLVGLIVKASREDQHG